MSNLEKHSSLDNVVKTQEPQNKENNFTKEELVRDFKILESIVNQEVVNFNTETQEEFNKIKKSSNLSPDEIKLIEDQTNVIDDLNEIKTQAEKIGILDNVKKVFKKIIFVTVMSTTLGYNPDSNLKDYSLEKHFEEAFAKAKNTGDKEFIWKGEKYNTLSKNKEGVPIKQRDDFTGNEMSGPGLWYAKIEANLFLDDDLNTGENPYNELFDLYRYYFGQPLESNILSISTTKPENSKDPNARYISINDKAFINDVLKEYRELKKPLEIGESARVSGYRDSKIPKNNTTSALGNFKIGRGVDDKGEYVSYYDVFDQRDDEAEKFFGAKRYEVYDRIYLKDLDNK